jgi:hypothetical protein
MKIIVPLAGPDFQLPDGSVKAEIDIGGAPLLRRALESRSWRRRRTVADVDYVFVLRDSAPSRRFAAEKLAAWHPGSRAVFLSAFAQGAAMSAMAGLSLFAHVDEPICVELADILFDEETDPLAEFSDPSVGALGLTLRSDNPAYSYLRRDEDGRVVEAVEKRAVSTEASAGVYFFRSPAVYLRACAHLLGRDEYLHQSLYYVCPLFNGVLAQGLDVRALPVENVRDLKVEPVRD